MLIIISTIILKEKQSDKEAFSADGELCCKLMAFTGRAVHLEEVEMFHRSHKRSSISAL